MDGDIHLGRPTGVRARAQPVEPGGIARAARWRSQTVSWFDQAHRTSPMTCLNLLMAASARARAVVLDVCCQAMRPCSVMSGEPRCNQARVAPTCFDVPAGLVEPHHGSTDAIAPYARCLPIRRAGIVGPAAWARSRRSRVAGRRPPRGSTSVPFGCLDPSRRRCPMRACASSHSASGFTLDKSCGGLPITPVSPVAARTCASAPRCLRRSRG